MNPAQGVLRAVHDALSGMVARAESAFDARLYTNYLEESTIAVTGSVCRSVHNHTDTQWLFDNSG